MKQLGFLLIEIMLYLALATGIALLTFQWLITTHQRLFSMGAQTNNLVQLHTAGDMLCRDIMHASSEQDQWSTDESEKIALSVQGKRVVWYRDKQNLIRQSVQKNKRSRSVVADNITVLSCSVINNEQGGVNAVRFSISGLIGKNVSSVTCTIALRNKTELV